MQDIWKDTTDSRKIWPEEKKRDPGFWLRDIWSKVKDVLGYEQKPQSVATMHSNSGVRIPEQERREEPKIDRAMYSVGERDAKLVRHMEELQARNETLLGKMHNGTATRGDIQERINNDKEIKKDHEAISRHNSSAKDPSYNKGFESGYKAYEAERTSIKAYAELTAGMTEKQRASMEHDRAYGKPIEHNNLHNLSERDRSMYEQGVKFRQQLRTPEGREQINREMVSTGVRDSRNHAAAPDIAETLYQRYR